MARCPKAARERVRSLNQHYQRLLRRAFELRYNRLHRRPGGFQHMARKARTDAEEREVSKRITALEARYPWVI